MSNGGKRKVCSGSRFRGSDADTDPEQQRARGRTVALSDEPTAILINTSRGAVLDEKALAKALKEGRIKGAGWTFRTGISKS